jgi:hypothetical protein
MNTPIRGSLFILMLFFVSGFAECYKPVTKNQLPLDSNDRCAGVSDGEPGAAL